MRKINNYLITEDNVDIIHCNNKYLKEFVNRTPNVDSINFILLESDSNNNLKGIAYSIKDDKMYSRIKILEASNVNDMSIACILNTNTPFCTIYGNNITEITNESNDLFDDFIISNEHGCISYDVAEFKKMYNNTKILFEDADALVSDEYADKESERFKSSNNLVIDTDKSKNDIKNDYIQWNKMTKKQRRVSDWKSMELYGKTNRQRYEEIMGGDAYIGIDESMHIIDGDYIKSDDESLLRKTYNGIEITEDKIRQIKDWNNENPIYKIIIPEVFDKIDKEYIQNLEIQWDQWNSMLKRNKLMSNRKCISILGLTNQELYEYMKSISLNIYEPDVEVKDPTSIPNNIVIESVNHHNDNIMALIYGYLGYNVIKENSITEIDNIIYPSGYYYDENYMPEKYNEVSPYITELIGTDSSISISEWKDLYFAAKNGFVADDFIKFESVRISTINNLYKLLETNKLLMEEDFDNYDIHKNTVLSIEKSLIELSIDPNRTDVSQMIKESKEYHKEMYDKKCNNIKIIDVSNLKCSYIEESASDTAEKLYPIYIVQLYSGRWQTEIIVKFTKGRFTHIGISLDPDLQKIYSFKGKGFEVEGIDLYMNEKTLEKMQIAVHCLFINKSDYEKITKKLDYYLKHMRQTHYDYLRLLAIVINKSGSVEDKMICSQFVASLLDSINIDLTNKDPSISTPNDFIFDNNEYVYKVYDGSVKEFDPNEPNFKNKIKLLRKTVKVSYKNSIKNKEKIESILNSDDLKEIREAFYGVDLSNNTELLPYIETQVCILEKAFPIKMDEDGNLIIKNFKKIDFEKEYYKSHAILMMYVQNNNKDGIKYEIAKQWCLYLGIEEKLHGNKELPQEEMKYLYKIRAKILNDIKTNIKIVLKDEPDFNFSEFYDNSPFSKATTKVDKSLLKFAGAIIRSILRL
jgi:hypothetical protein